MKRCVVPKCKRKIKGCHRNMLCSGHLFLWSAHLSEKGVFSDYYDGPLQTRDFLMNWARTQGDLNV